jgi:hyperosmotically inducible protein
MKSPLLAARAGLVFLALALGACSATRTQQAPGEVIDDSLLTGKVKAALIDDPVTKAGDINVETYRGVVQLGGFVDSADQKTRATEVAKSVTGVKEVRNDLRVSSPQATTGQVVDDTAITSSVKAKLVSDTRTDAHQINVETQKGVVQLTGFVDSAEMKTKAGDVARTVDGVVNVRNDLEIRQKP